MTYRSLLAGQEDPETWLGTVELFQVFLIHQDDELKCFGDLHLYVKILMSLMSGQV